MPARKSESSPARIKWVGPADQALPGVPHGPLTVTDSPSDESQVTVERAQELVGTGLYANEEVG